MVGHCSFANVFSSSLPLRINQTTKDVSKIQLMPTIFFLFSTENISTTKKSLASLLTGNDGILNNMKWCTFLCWLRKKVRKMKQRSESLKPIVDNL